MCVWTFHALQNHKPDGERVNRTFVAVYERMARYLLVMEHQMVGLTDQDGFESWRTNAGHGKPNAESLSETWRGYGLAQWLRRRNPYAPLSSLPQASRTPSRSPRRSPRCRRTPHDDDPTGGLDERAWRLLPSGLVRWPILTCVPRTSSLDRRPTTTTGSTTTVTSEWLREAILMWHVFSRPQANDDHGLDDDGYF